MNALNSIQILMSHKEKRRQGDSYKFFFNVKILQGPGEKVTEENEFSVYIAPERHLIPLAWQAELIWTELLLPTQRDT